LPKKGAESVVAFLMVMAIGSAVAFLFAYWTNAGNVLLGGTLALCVGAVGAALAFYSHSLMAQEQVVERRESLASPRGEPEAASRDFDSGIQRRGLLKGLGVAVIGTMAAIVISLFRSLGQPPGSSLFTRVWKQGQRLTGLDGTPITVNALQPGSSMVVFPEESVGDEKSQTVLIRVREELLQLPKDRADWAPMGYVAYSRVCTHAGCPVGVFESTTDLLMCPCHQSTFDVLRAAQPTSGPADRPLPQLPLYVDADGTLRAAGGFSEPPGPGFWGMP
jgi:ubiquinol-cytochrome c reductase iron-sulfur subunit